MPDFDTAETYRRPDDDFDLPRYTVHESRVNPYGSTLSSASSQPYTSMAYSPTMGAVHSNSNARQHPTRLSQILDTDTLGAASLGRSASLGGLAARTRNANPSHDLERAFNDNSSTRHGEQFVSSGSFYPSAIGYSSSSSSNVEPTNLGHDPPNFPSRRALTSRGHVSCTRRSFVK
jgi:hypothetical protein